jgi:hypothetical protein
MGLLPQLVHDPQSRLRRQAGICERIGLIGFLETAEDAEDFLHTSLYLAYCYDKLRSARTSSRYEWRCAPHPLRF